ncbi:MAG: RNB domain-containing ribonuclease [SAR202 cluster bacterium]|nr:RNB domain-containing ribonuclease [SAR202 cluster bacterium]
MREKAQEEAAKIDLAEAWEVLRDEPRAISPSDLAELYWGGNVEVTRLIALVLHLEEGTDFFTADGTGYMPRTLEAVEEIRTRRRRETENAEAAQSLMLALSAGKLPDPFTKAHATLLQHLRGFAVHGDEYPRSHAAHSLLHIVDAGARDLQRRAFELLVAAGVFSPDEPLELLRTEITDKFPPEALAEAEAISVEQSLEGGQWRDLTALEVVTIDDVTTLDRDDALSLEFPEGGDPKRAYRIGIHIADAGALIPPGGAVDLEADRRMATLYMPERHIEMLPVVFTRNAGSLDPGQTRLAMSLMVDCDAEWSITGYEIVPSIIRSRAAVPYAEVDVALKDDTHPWHWMLDKLNDAARAFRKKREEAGAIMLDRSEMDIKVDGEGKITVKVFQPSQSREMVAEMMILCNSMLAQFCKEKGIPATYRAQTAPDISDIKLTREDGSPLPHGPLLRYPIARRFLPAEITTVPARHGGLGVDAYIQATSPLRRYPDLVMQRQISRFLSTGQPFYPQDAIASVVGRAEVQLRELNQVENERERYWFLKHLKLTRLEESGAPAAASLFAAVVLENEPRRPAMLELEEFPFRVRTELPRGVNPGDRVVLRLAGVDLWRKQGHFVYIGAAR